MDAETVLYKKTLQSKTLIKVKYQSVCGSRNSFKHNLNTVDSRYLKIEGTLKNTSRYPYFDISDL